MPLPPVVFTLTEFTRAPAQVVFDLLTDWRRQPEWMDEMQKVEMTTEHLQGVGVEGFATIRMGGVTTTDPVRVDEWDSPRRLGLAHLGWVSGTDTFTLEPLIDGGTVIRWVQRFTPPLWILGAIGMRVWAPLMRRTFRKDLARLARIAEQDAGL